MDPLSDDRLTLVGLLIESTTALRSQLDRLLERDADLPLQWFELLLRLARSPGRHLRMSDLAAQTRLTPSGLTRAIDRLEDAGLAERVPCPSDRRGSFAALTPRGLAADEQAQLASLLRKVRDHVNPAAATAIPVGPVT